MYRIFFVSVCISILCFTCKSPEEKIHVEQWDVYEIVLNGSNTGNPYMDVTLSAVFENKTKSLEVPGFYDGDGRFIIRFSPPFQGTWSYRTESTLEELAGQGGEFECIAPAGNNHGPLEIVNTYYLQYADGTPFYSVGTTAYQWTSVDQKIQEKTIQTLRNAPFNKVRMCFFPKSYSFGNDTEPWAYPFKRKDTINDLSQPNYAFFRNFDQRIKELCDMGIQADVILFHPYDKWGYSKMGKEMNEKFVRYMIARISAYRNVWWSLANEWDIPSIKDSIDWEGIGNLLKNEDPYQRFRGIHNWYDTEDHFYDHSRPWITHVSAQTSQFYNAIQWREKYKKPLLFDEMRYEGDVPRGWGNLSAEGMTSYFWMAGLSGAYPTHGDTYNNAADDSTEVRWWAKGGLLAGDSPERIAFFRSVMEEAPVAEMNPVLIDQGDPDNLENNIHIFEKPGEYYLIYVAESSQIISLNLPGEQNYLMEILDTWKMEIVEARTVKAGKFEYKTTSPFTALRIYR